MITSAARRAASGARRAKEIRARTAETASIISGHSGAPPSVRASSTKARSSGAKFQVLWPSPPVSPPLVLRGSGTLRGYESLRIWDEDGFLLSGGKRGGHGGPSRNRGAGNNYRNGNGKKSRPPFQSINGRSFSTKAAPQADGDGDEKEKTGTLIDKTRVPPSPSASPPSTPSSSSSTAATATATKAASPSSSLSTSARLRQKLMLADLQTPPSTQSKLSALLRSLPGTLLSGLSAFRVWCVQFSKELAADPKRKLSELRHAFVEEAKHYWVGSKLLWADVKITTEILLNMAFGNRLTRRERKQLVRTTTDLLRLVPMSVFVLVPFMEIFLPLALKVFPNMLPSTFEDSLKKEESMKKELKMRLAMAGFMKDMLREMAKDVKTHKDDEGHSAREVTNFVAKAKRGSVDNDDIFKFAKLFKDDLTLDNLSRTQLVTMCTFMSLPPYGADAFMRYNLRAALRDIQNDDQRILFEGLESLNRSELQEASRERGMRALGLSKDELRLQLQEWLNLSCNQQVPISLLILSRSFALSRGSGSSQGRDTSISGGAGGGGGSVSQTSSEQSKQSSLATDLAQSISSLDYEIVNEVVLDVATPEERRSKEIRSLKLEAYEHQAELIADEKEEHDRDMEAMKAKVAKQERTGQAALTAGGSAVLDDAGAAETATTEADPATAAAAAIAVSGDEETKQEDEEVKQGEGKKTTATTKEASAVLGDFSLEKTDEVGPSMAAALAGGAELQDQLQLQDEKLDGAEPSPAEGIEAAAAAAGGAEEANGANGGDSNGEDEDEDELGVEDLEALATFASLSAVDDEKLFCEKIKKEVEDMHLSEDVKDGHDVTAAGDAAATAAAAAWKEAEKESSSGVVNTDDLAEKVRADFGIATEGGGGDNQAAAAAAAAAAADQEKKEGEGKQRGAAKKDEQEVAAVVEGEAPQQVSSNKAADAEGAGANDSGDEASPSSALSMRAELKASKVRALAANDVVELEAIEAAERELEDQERELKQELEKRSIKQSGGDAAAAAGDAGDGDGSDGREQVRDAVLGRISGSLGNMLTRLEADIAKVDQAIGEKLHVLDLDSDGLLSEKELIAVLQTMMRTKLTEEEAQRKVRKLMEDIDEDCDGVVSVEELRSWVQLQRRKKDVEVHERSLEKEAKEAEKQQQQKQQNAEALARVGDSAAELLAGIAKSTSAKDK